MPEETPSRGEVSAQTDPNNPASVAAAAAALRFTRAPDYKVCFSDFHRSRVGNGTFTIVFSRIEAHTPSPQMPANVVEEHVEIIMSWTQLKLVTENLVSAIAAIEAEVGAIPFPRNFQINEEANRAIVRALGLSPTSEAPPGAKSD